VVVVMSGRELTERIDSVQKAVDDAVEGLSTADYHELLGELLGMAEGWRMVLAEAEDEEDAEA
jgi:hypothetical protein